MSDKIIACGLTLKEIEKLADKVEKGNLSKIKIKNDDSEVCIEKSSAPVMAAVPPMPMPVQSAAVPASVPAEAAAVTGEEKTYDGNVVKSPIVGTYYAAPAPDKDPFVTVGKQVAKGDVIMIIESMKLMNEVQSELDGVVTEILVDNGEPVEYGQPIMVIK